MCNKSIELFLSYIIFIVNIILDISYSLSSCHT